MVDANISGVYTPSLSSSLIPLHQVLVCRTHVLPPLLQIWRHAPEEDVKAQKIRAEMFDSWKDIEGILHHQDRCYMPGIIRTELISRHHDEGALASRKLENLLPEITIGRARDLQSLPIPINKVCLWTEPK